MRRNFCPASRQEKLQNFLLGLLVSNCRPHIGHIITFAMSCAFPYLPLK